MGKKLQSLYMSMSDYDIRFVQAQADTIDSLDHNTSKPLFILYKVRAAPSSPFPAPPPLRRLTLACSGA